jgi:hypothetical protein
MPVCWVQQDKDALVCADDDDDGDDDDDDD